MTDPHHDAHGEHEHHGPRSFWTKYVFATDHKVIGMQFMFSSLLFVILGGLLALGVRWQIAFPNQHVPYHGIMPGGVLPEEMGDQRMTARVAEENTGRWSIGGPVVLKDDLVVGGKTYPQGTTGRFTSFPKGLAVTIPARTVVEERAAALSEPIDGFIDPMMVIGDYDYKQFPPHVRTSTGVTVTVPAAGPGGSDRILTLKAILVPRPNGEIDEEVGKITLPIRADATPITIDIEKQILGEDADAIEIEATSLSTYRPIDSEQAVPLTADLVEYPIQQLTGDAYLTLFTMHASIMIFFVIIPMLVGGFGNFLIPLMIGARDMAFPKINMLSFWIAAVVGVLMIASFWVDRGAAGGGWTMYPPLSGAQPVMKSTVGTTIWVIGVGIVGFSSIVGALNYITTIINMRAPGMTMFRMPLTVWSLFITAILQLFATPVLTASMILLLFDRVLGTMFFAPVVNDTAVGGQPLLFQHLFWFYSHPAVYIMILPAMGLTSDILASYARKPVFGYKPMVYAISGIAGLGFIVWGHHMFQSGMNPVLGTTFMASTIFIAVPSAIKVFNWMGTLWGGDIRFTPAMLFAIGFVSMFTIGGLSGIFMASTPVDIQIHDTYFIVAHIHYVLFGGSIFGIFAGIYHWFPKMFGRDMNYKWGVIHFIMLIIAFNGTFFLMHVLGVGGQPRRYASNMEYPGLKHMQDLNVIMTLWAMSLGLAQLPFFYNFFTSLPRKLGRGVVAAFAVGLIVPVVIGYTFWTGVNWDPESSAVGPQDLLDYTTTWLGYAGTIGGLAVLLLALLIGLPRGGKIAAFIVIGATGWQCLSVVHAALFGELPLGLATLEHNLIVAVGNGVVASVAIVLAVFGVWAIGGMSASALLMLLVPPLMAALQALLTACGVYAHGLAAMVAGGWFWVSYYLVTLIVYVMVLRSGERLTMTSFLQRAMYVWFLPVFLAPMLVREDLFIMRGLPGLIEYRWLLMVLVALPGTAYLVMRCPKDAFGAPAPRNPHNLNSLEWVADSPPIHLNFETIPTVHRGPYEYSSPAVEEDFLPQDRSLPPGVTEPAGH